MKNILNSAVLFLLMSSSYFTAPLLAVSAKKAQENSTATNAVTTYAAQHAQNDVQIRRLKNLFVEKQLDSDDFYEKLQKLRSSTRK